MIDRILPAGLNAAETRQHLGAELFPEERDAIARAAEKRRLEFTTGRACARRALRRLGLPAGPIRTGAAGSPVWPDGVVGSITHCPGYCAAVVARATEYRAVGIDAERGVALPRGVRERIASERERALIAALTGASAVPIDTLIFSAKEAVIKLWFPLTSELLGFRDVEITLDLETQAFYADGARLAQLEGGWTLSDGVLATAVAISSAGCS